MYRMGVQLFVAMSEAEHLCQRCLRGCLIIQRLWTKSLEIIVAVQGILSGGGCTALLEQREIERVTRIEREIAG